MNLLSRGIAVGVVFQRYSHHEIREALQRETSDKCAYCESKIRHVAPEHIDHILPKSVRPELIVEWGNLTLACPLCNQLKGTYYSAAEPLLNPYVDRPSEHLLFLGPLILSRPGSKKGALTARKLALSRVELIERRREKIQGLHALLDLWARTQPGELKTLLAAELRLAILPDAEYSATIEAFFREAGFPATLRKGVET